MSNPVLTDAIDRLANGRDLSADEAARVLREVMEGNAEEAEIAGFLIGLPFTLSVDVAFLPLSGFLFLLFWDGYYLL